MIIVKVGFGQTPTPPTNFGTASTCCAGANYTIGISEATNINNKLPSIQFHTSGFQEAFLRLAAESRVFEIGDNQGVGVDFSIRNPANTVRSVYLSGKGISYFNGGNIGIGTTTPSEKLEVNGNIQLAGTIKYGNSGVRTESRDDAGLQGNAGALSGFYETYAPQNFPKDASSWWHLIDSRHSNNGNNYAMQIAGSFFDQKLYFRKTNSSPTTTWREIVSVDAVGRINLDNDAAGLKKSVILGGYVYGGAIRFNANSGIANSRNLELGNSDNNGIFYPSVVVSAETGNLGIGIANPTTKLDISGSIKVTGDADNVAYWFPNNQAMRTNVVNSNSYFDVGNFYIRNGNATGNATLRLFGGQLIGNSYYSYTNTAPANGLAVEGNVGIGTINPTAKLEIYNGSVLVNTPRTSTGSIIPIAVGTQYYTGTPTKGLAGLYHIESGTSGFGQSGGLGFYTSSDDILPTEKVRITNNGNVGIGTTDTKGYKLAVGGDIIAERVVVKLTGTWPDYVFKKNYGLRPLEQVEQFINQNSHLPEVPSAQEITDKGIDVGAMNAKLLQKVEELTLYLIEQNKEIKALKNKVEVLEKK